MDKYNKPTLICSLLQEQLTTFDLALAGFEKISHLVPQNYRSDSSSYICFKDGIKFYKFFISKYVVF